MGTHKQFLTTIAIAAAVLVAWTAMPDSAQAFYFHRPNRGAPEVDPGTISSAIALAMGGLAVLADKLRRR
jgi:hypothetical protein